MIVAPDVAEHWFCAAMLLDAQPNDALTATNWISSRARPEKQTKDGLRCRMKNSKAVPPGADRGGQLSRHALLVLSFSLQVSYKRDRRINSNLWADHHG